MAKKIFLTPSGLTEKEEEKKRLQRERKTAVAELVVARNMGDLSENGAYKAARFRLSGLDRRLRYIENVLRRVAVIEKRTDGRVGIGSIVQVATAEKEITLEIVDGHESDFMRGKISLYSPVGKKLMGRRVNEKVEVVTISGIVVYTVLKVD